MALHRLCPRCTTTVPHPGLCPRCQRNRGTTTQRGYGHTWQKLARQARAAHPYCANCGATGDLTVDHRDPTTRGRTDLTLADVDVLCRTCNSRKGARGGGQGVDGNGNANDPVSPFRETHMLVG